MWFKWDASLDTPTKDPLGNMASFRDFPSETICNIVSHLSSTRDLKEVSLVDKRLCELSRRSLYKNIELAWNSRRDPPLVRLLNNALRRPEIGNYVQSITCKGHDFIEKIPVQPVPKMHVGDLDLDGCTELVKSFKVPFEDVWIREITVGTVDALLALFVAISTRLRTLQLSKNWTKSTNRFVGELFETALCQPGDSCLPKFEDLEDVALAFEQDFHRSVTHNHDSIMPLFYLPKIKHIQAAMHNLPVWQWPSQSAPDPSLLTSLDLRYIREEQLGKILALTPSLKKLKWEWYFRPGVEGCENPIADLDAICAALQPVRTTLTELKLLALSVVRLGDWEEEPVTIRGSLAPLSSFNIKTLEVPIPFLAGWSPDEQQDFRQVIPEQIESFTISDDLMTQEQYNWKSLAMMETSSKFLSAAESEFPTLKEFSIIVNGMNRFRWDQKACWKFEDQREAKRVRASVIAGDDRYD